MNPDLMRRRRFLQTASAGPLALWAGSPAQATTPSDRPVRLIVPFPAGGVLDVVVRQVTQSMARTLGQTFVVDNLPGGGTVIGTAVAAKAAPDGHTLLAVSNSFTIGPALRSDLPYVPARDFRALGEMAGTPLVLCAQPGLQADTMPALAALLRAKPDGFSCASTGNGSLPHLMGEMLNAKLGVRLVHVPFNGSPPALNALAGGQVDLSFGLLPDVLPLVRAGRIKALGVAHASRVAQAPELPTLVEQLPALDLFGRVWFALVAPAGVPDAAMDRLGGALQVALEDPGVRSLLTARGYDGGSSGSAALQALLAAEATRYAAIVRQANIRVE